MIFAICDLLLYRFKLLRYSDSAIRATGAVRAKAAESATMIQQAQTGDILFYHPTNSLQSWIIMYISDGIWSHCAMCVGNGLVHDVTTAGVIVHSLSDYCDGNGYLLIRKLGRNSDQAARILRFMKSTLGRGYNWPGVIRLGILTLFAGVSGYRCRLGIDLLLVLALVFWMVSFSPWLSSAVLLIAAGYVLIVTRNVLARALEPAQRATRSNERVSVRMPLFPPAGEIVSIFMVLAVGFVIFGCRVGRFGVYAMTALSSLLLLYLLANAIYHRYKASLMPIVVATLFLGRSERRFVLSRLRPCTRREVRRLRAIERAKRLRKFGFGWKRGTDSLIRGE